eukprot:TRINITY_DN35955_c0_g2_i1.p1 TRINITY_DN35955_c0_g2~~TRINITY_DN35955_c0_g2_i1.p1  ORF type:complete len:393 (+),score=83.48 TRINITY_DN35955_c0_g2_i1:157-1179(+)
MSDRKRARILFIQRRCPKFKLELKNRTTIFLICAAVFAFLHQSLRAVSIILHNYVSSPEACDVMARMFGTCLCIAYFFMIQLMLIRTRAAELPEIPKSKFEKFLAVLVWIFLLIALSIPIVSSGQIELFQDSTTSTTSSGNQIQQPQQQKQPQEPLRACILRIDVVSFASVFIVFDLFVSSSLVWLFYKRIRNLATSSGLGTNDKIKYMEIAKKNMISSATIIACTVTITLITALSSQIQHKFQVYGIGFELITSTALTIIICSMAWIFKNAFEWPRRIVPEDASKGDDRNTGVFSMRKLNSDDTSMRKLGSDDGGPRDITSAGSAGMMSISSAESDVKS